MEDKTLPTMETLDAVSDFVSALIWDEAHYNEPCPITRTEAAYTLRQMASEGRDLPAGITPDLFCYFWNMHCDRYIEF